MQQEEFFHEQELPVVPRAAKRAAEIGGCWRIGSSRQQPTTWANWADWTDSTDADDGERTQTAVEVENRVQKLRELMAQDPEMTQQAPDDLTALIQLTDQLTAQMRPDQVPQAAGPLLAQLQQGLRAFTANRSRTVSRSRSISSGSTPPCSWKQSLNIVMTETELDLLASRYDAASANERDSIMRGFQTKSRKREPEGPAA